MPTIDIRGGGKGGGESPKGAAPAGVTERDLIVKMYQARQRDELARAEREARDDQKQERLKAVQNAREEENRRRAIAKEQTQRQALMQREEKARIQLDQKSQAAQMRQSMKDEKDRQRIDLAILKKRQRDEETLARKLQMQKQREVLRLERERVRKEEQYDKDFASAHAYNTKRDSQEMKAGIFGGYAGAWKENQLGNSVYFKNIERAEKEHARMYPPMMTPGGAPVSDVAGGLEAGALFSLFKKFVAIAGTVIDAPLMAGQIMRGANALAQPYMDLKKSAFTLGRAGGFGGGMLGPLMSGGWQAPLGLTSDKVLQSLQSYGIAPRSAAEAKDTVSMMARQSLMPGFSGMEPGTVEASLRQMQGYSNMSAVGQNQYLTSISMVMEDAIAKGMDRAKVLGNIQSSMDTIAGTGAGGLSSKGVIDLFARFGGAGTPGGRTGQEAAAAIAGTSAFAQNPLSNIPGFFLLQSQMGKFNNLKTADDIRKFVGEQNWNATSEKVRNLAVNQITEAANKGMVGPALVTAMQQLMGADPSRLPQLQKAGVDKMHLPGALAVQALANANGWTPQQAEHYLAGEGSTLAGGVSSRTGGDAKAQMEYIRKNTPQDVFGAESLANQATLSGAATELKYLVPAAEAATLALMKLSVAAGGATDALTSNANTPRGANPTGSLFLGYANGILGSYGAPLIANNYTAPKHATGASQ